MRNIKLTIEYDGTNYFGWQKQKNKITVQQIIEEALFKVTKENIDLIGSGRTDAGVHALNQTANFKTSGKIKTEKVPFALNSILPRDIVIKNAQEVSDDFHARFSAKGKKYKYLILNNKYPSALQRNYVYFYPYNLDFNAMQQSCQYIIGEHDFSAFKAVGSSAKTSTRTIYSANFLQADDIIEFYIYGDGFLYNMVRIIVGTLLDVGQGKIESCDIEKIILSKDRTKAGKTVPAHGLYLVEVYY